MKVSYNWLKNYLPQEIAPEELSKILTSIGLEVEEMETREAVPGGMKGLVTGLVETCHLHENADKLKVTTVRVNNTTILPIVCGAPNVAAGQKVIVATVGTSLPTREGGTFTIKKAKIRGEVSEGMICAEDEIGMGESHEGILILPENTPIGIPAAEYFSLPESDTIFHIGLTPNRSDANSHLGVAKDVCAYWTYHQNRVIRPAYPSTNLPEKLKTTALPLEATIENASACLRYAGLVVSGIKVAPSPAWLKERLASIGILPVNNIVDITNFILQEYGQPLHAFDYDKIDGQEIVVKNLPEGTPFATLDNTEVKLNEEDLMICDGKGKPLCLAGVYGGNHSGISNSTQNVFIESAYFAPRTIRRSSIRHGFRTEAATHFEKGVEMKNILPALFRAAEMIMEIAGGQVASKLIDNYPKSLQEKKIPFSFAYLNRICGKDFEPDSVKQLLEALGFPCKEEGKENLIVSVPFENPDIHQPADLAEEILRMDGLDNIPIPERLHYTLNKSNNRNDFRKLKERMAEFLAYSGLQEIITNSITNSKYYPEREKIVYLLNSLSSELDILRPEMLESGLEVIAYNLNRKMNDIHLFDFGKTYTDKGNQHYEQKEWLSIWSSGHIRPAHWEQPAEKTDFFVLKGLMTALFALAGLKKVQETVADGKFIWKRGKQEIGVLYEVAAEDQKRFGIKQKVYYAAIHLENLWLAVKNNNIHHSDPPKFPAVKRDLALILPKNIAYEQLAAIAGKQKWEALQSFELFDIFEHEKIGAENKSMALSFTFQLQDRTLTDTEVDEMMQKLIQAYEQKLKATLRS